MVFAILLGLFFYLLMKRAAMDQRNATFVREREYMNRLQADILSEIKDTGHVDKADINSILGKEFYKNSNLRPAIITGGSEIKIVFNGPDLIESTEDDFVIHITSEGHSSILKVGSKSP